MASKALEPRNAYRYVSKKDDSSAGNMMTMRVEFNQSTSNRSLEDQPIKSGREMTILSVAKAGLQAAGIKDENEMTI